MLAVILLHLLCLLLNSLHLCESKNRIAQGEDAKFEDWKFVVDLRIIFPSLDGSNKYDNYMSACTGTMIQCEKGTFILTAGHCFQRVNTTNRHDFNKDPALKYVDFKTVLFRGVIDVMYPVRESLVGLTTITATFEEKTARIPRQMFGEGRKISELDGDGLVYSPMDFALIKLNDNCFEDPPVVLRGVKPISTEQLFNANCQLAGWGKNGTDKELFEGRTVEVDILQTGNLTVLDTRIEENRLKCTESSQKPSSYAQLPLCLTWNAKLDRNPRITEGDSGGTIFCDINGKRQFAGVISTSAYEYDVLCSRDTVEREFLQYAEMTLNVAPVSNIFKFISEQNWGGAEPRCSFRKLISCKVGCVWPRAH